VTESSYIPGTLHKLVIVEHELEGIEDERDWITYARWLHCSCRSGRVDCEYNQGQKSSEYQSWGISTGALEEGSETARVETHSFCSVCVDCLLFNHNFRQR